MNFQSTTELKLDKSKGLKWYRFFQFFLILFAICSLFSSLLMPFAFDEYRPSSRFFSFLCSFTYSILCIRIFYHMHKESAKCIKDMKFTIILTTVLDAIAYMSFFGESSMYSYPLYFDPLSLWLMLLFMFILSTLFFCALYVPTYFYLKHRFYSPVTSSSYTLPILGPQKVIPVRLLGVSDQAQRDKIVAEIMGKTVNPYTGNHIVNEAEWNIYLHSIPNSVSSTLSPEQHLPERNINK